MALGVPAYVKSINADSSDVELITDPALLETQSFDISQENFQTRQIPSPEEELLVQIRYRTPPAPGHLLPGNNGHYRIVLNVPIRAVTPGQSAVIYRGNTLLGGGIIN